MQKTAQLAPTNYAFNRFSVDNAAKFPEKALAVRQNFYVGDYLDSRPTLEGFESLANDLIKLFSIGGFKLTKWISNSPLLADRHNTFADSNHNRQRKLSSVTSIQGHLDKTLTNTMSSPRQRTSKSTQLGSSKVSPPSPRYNTRPSTLKVNAMENLIAVKKLSLGDAVHTLVRSQTYHVARVSKNQAMRRLSMFSLNIINCNSSKPICARFALEHRSSHSDC